MHDVLGHREPRSGVAIQAHRPDVAEGLGCCVAPLLAMTAFEMSCFSSLHSSNELTMSRPPIHPGEILADELEGIGITATELSRQLNVPQNRMSQIIAGERGITGDTALRLGHWFGNSAEFWLNLQAAFDLRVAAAAVGAKIQALPVSPLLTPVGRRSFDEMTGKGR